MGNNLFWRTLSTEQFLFIHILLTPWVTLKLMMCRAFPTFCVKMLVSRDYVVRSVCLSKRKTPFLYNERSFNRLKVCLRIGYDFLCFYLTLLMKKQILSFLLAMKQHFSHINHNEHRKQGSSFESFRIGNGQKRISCEKDKQKCTKNWIVPLKNYFE